MCAVKELMQICCVMAIAGMSNLQVALDSVEQKLANHEARLQEVRDDMKKAKALNDREALQELRQTERELLGLIKELQVKENRLSNQLGE